MAKRRKETIFIPNLEITDYAAEGKSIGRYNGKVIFVPNTIPGDVVTVRLVKNKKDWAEGIVTQLEKPAANRIEPFCRHFGTCGGCKWQFVPYDEQATFKQKEAFENLTRLGAISNLNMLPIAKAPQDRGYRNKLEFTCSNKTYLTAEDLTAETEPNVYKNALGFHAPRVYDKAVNITTCWLMDDVNNQIRNTVRAIAEENNFSFYDAKQHTGWLRNIMVRYTTLGELLVLIVINFENEVDTQILCTSLLEAVPSITSLQVGINSKFNDSIYDIPLQTITGNGFVQEQLGKYIFNISAKSFFQTNTKQAIQLYSIAKDFANLTGNEVLYDLYCGTGSIGIFMSDAVQKIIGVDSVADAIENAKKNAAQNNITNAHYYTGDVIKICNSAFFNQHGSPDVVVVDPPRSGIHQTLIAKLLEIKAPTIVYISCNTATMARDIALLQAGYDVTVAQPVDMFPQTHHIECVAQLRLKN